MFGQKATLANGRPAPRKIGVWNIIAHPDTADEWNKPNQIEARLTEARRSAEEIAAWRRLVKAR